MRDDYHILGRIYFPGVDITDFNSDSKKQIEKEIEDDFRIALEGIKLLPSSAKSGVYLAYIYYLSLFNKIKKSPAQKVLTQRIRINNGKKFGLMINSLVQNKMNWV